MSGHTPGPYELYAEGHTIVVGDVATHTDLAEFFYADEHTVSTTRDEALANAKLFRAAPDLLLALKLILPLAKGYAPPGQTEQARRTCNDWIGAAMAAIERATGGGP